MRKKIEVSKKELESCEPDQSQQEVTHFWQLLSCKLTSRSETCWCLFFPLELEVCWVPQAARGKTERPTGRASVLVSRLTPLTWQGLPTRPWTNKPDWIKPLPRWRIECSCQHDVSTSSTTSPPYQPFWTSILWQPLCCPPPPRGIHVLTWAAFLTPLLLLLHSGVERSGNEGISRYPWGAPTTWLLLTRKPSYLVSVDGWFPQKGLYLLLKLPPSYGEWGACKDQPVLCPRFSF